MSSSLNRTQEVVNKVRHIQEEAETKDKGSAKYITDRCNTIATDEHKRLNVIVDKKTGEILSEPHCSYRYYCQLMEDYRNGVKALGFKHHSIERHVNSFIRKYSDKNESLAEKLESSLPIQKLRDNLILLRSSSITGSDYRKDLLNLKVEHHAYYMFEPKGAVKDWVRDDDKKKLSGKLHSQILINPNWIKNLASDLIKKKDASDSDLCIAITLATGRRLTEVMKTAVFKKVDDKTLLFSGQLKTKNRHLFEEITPYKIPSMIDADLVVKALKKLRGNTEKVKLSYKNVLGETVESLISEGDTKDYYHNRAVQKRYESTMNRAIRSLMKDGHFSHKDCRAIYTEITYEEHSLPGEARSAYRHRVLGHSLIETQLHYEAFQLDTSVKSIQRKDEGSDEPMTDQQKALVEYLGKADADVLGYARAPKIAIMHEWLKAEVANGLKIELITPSYIRRHCLFDGKQLNLNTIKKYVHEFIQLDQYVPPKDKPKKPDNKKEKEIFELEERIELAQIRADEVEFERQELEDELAGLKERIEEVEAEDEDLDLEQGTLNDDLDDMQSELEDLQAELEEIKLKEKQEQEAPFVWPDAADIDVKSKKEGKQWHVWAVLNEEVFEIWTGGTKIKAIKELRNYYKKSILNKSV